MSLSKEREFFSANLALLLKAGVPIGETFASLVQTASSSQMKKRLKKMEKLIDEGTPLSVTLQKSGLVSNETLTLVELGEQSGNLAANLEVAAQQEQKQRVFRSKLRSAMLYPAFVLVITLVVGLGIAWFLLPRLAETFSQLGAQLPPISKVMIGIGLFLRDNGIWAVPSAIAAVAAAVIVCSAIPFLRRIVRRLVLHLPGLGRLTKELEIARFGYMLGTLLDAGLPVTKALSLLQKSSNSPRYQALFHHMAQSLDKGMSFQESFKQHKRINSILPPSTQQVIIAGERSGSLPQTLRLVGTTYEQKVEATTKNLEVIIEPVLLVGVWLGVLFVAIGVILPIYSLIGGLST